MYITIFILLLLAILCIIIFHFKKKRIIKKICCMSFQSKCCLLNEIANPLGYCYNQSQDIFSNTPDAWQKEYGYGTIYDRMAPLAGMVFDCKPVFFDYAEKTWRIEFWKGQYGINTGAEVGIYHADTLLPRSEWNTAIFSAATEAESPDVSMELFYKENPVAKISGSQWWLTVFSVGQFSDPKDLSLEISIRFPDFEMRNAFIDALYADKYDMDSLRLCLYYTDVLLSFSSSCGKTSACEKKHFLQKWFCRYIQWKNKIFCRLYCFVTRPFHCTYDKLLYLYFYLPFAARRLLRIRRFCRPRQTRKSSCQKRRSSCRKRRSS